MTQARAVVLLAILLLTTISFAWFPGHTFLLSDTQVYLPILQHIEDPGMLAADPMAIRPHVSFTVWDDLVLGLRHLTRLPWDYILIPLQFLCRAAGVLGLFLIARATGLSVAFSLTAAALLTLGATVNGPQVLSVEYEPVPRGFAFPVCILGMGLLARNCWNSAAVVLGIAWALHPLTAMPVWGLAFLLSLWQRQWLRSVFFLSGPLLLAATIPFQPASAEQSPFFARMDETLANLQKMRTSYAWVSTWFERFRVHFALLLTASLLASYWKRSHLPASLRPFFFLLPLGGALSIPVSWILTEQQRWMLGPQYQPARYVLFITFFAALSCALAGLHAAAKKRWPEAVAFLLVPCLIPLQPNLPDLSWQHAALALLAAATIAFARWPVLLAFALYPVLGGITNFPVVETPELTRLSEWAKANTPREAVFQFADVRRGLEPGVFRSRAARAIYADWKAGGQVNFQPNFAPIWGERWKQVERPQSLARYRELGVNYAVFGPEKAPKNKQPVWSNSRWKVFSTSE